MYRVGIVLSVLVALVLLMLPFVWTRGVLEVSSNTRVNYYAATHRLSPLFSLEGTDSKKFAVAVMEAQSGERVMARLFATSSDVVASQVRAWGFLSRLPELEVLRKEFISSPSQENAEVYHRALTAVLDIYQRELNRASETLYGMDYHVLGMWEGTTSVHTIARVLSKRAADVERIRNDENARYNCLTLLLYPCTPLTDYYPRMSTVPATMTMSSTTESLAKVLKNFLHTTGQEQDLRIVGLPATQCFFDSGNAWIASWQDSTLSTTAARFSRVDQLYFFDYSRRFLFKGKVAPSLSALEYQYFNPYLCVDYAHDAGAVLTIKKIVGHLTHEPLFTGCTETNCGVLPLLEKRITQQGEVIDGALVESYMIESARLLSQGEAKLAHSIGEQSVIRLEELLALWSGKSADMDMLIRAVDRTTPYTEQFIQEGHIPLWVWAVQRGHYSVYFMTANETFGASGSFVEQHGGTHPREFPLRLYLGDVEQFIPVSKLASFIKESLRIHE